MSGRLLLGFILCGLPTAALAASGGEQPSLFWSWVNFLALVAIIVFVGGKQLRAFLGDRRYGIEKDLDSAAEVLSKAENQLAQWKERVARLDQECDEIKQSTKRRAEAEREAILAEARAAAERIRNDAGAAVEQEVSRARQELKDEAAQLATQLAAEQLRQHVQASDQERLVDDFITRVGRETPAEGA